MTCTHPGASLTEMGTALITGASAGLGTEFAELFANDGHSLILVARRRDLLQDLAARLKQSNSNLRIDVIAMDLGVPGAGAQLFQKISALGLNVDFLVNNAGFGTNGEFDQLPLGKELQMMDLNMRTLVELTHLFLPAMKARRSGYILNVSSTAAFQPGPYMTTYYATKAFVTFFSEGLHEELLGSGISCTALCPGATATEFAKVSKIESSRLFKLHAANSKSVARTGYRAMLKRKPVAVSGLVNKILVQTLRICPRFVARKLAGFLNRT